MKLSRAQKKYLKKNLKGQSLTTIATELSVGEDQLLSYLKSIWSKKKYCQFLSQRKHQPTPPRKPTKYLVGGWLHQHQRPLIFLTLLVLVTYVNCLNNDFVADDLPAILENPNLGNPLFYLRQQPLNSLRNLLYVIAHQVGQLNPLPYRILNLIFHLGSVIVSYALLTLLYSPQLAIGVASVLAVHPILSEAVVWVSGGVYPQYSFFLLTSLLFYLLAQRQNWSKRYYLTSVISFLLALLTTEKAAILPLILLVFELTRGNLRPTIRRLAPYLLLGGLWIGVILFGGILTQRVSDLQSQYYQTGGFYNPLIQIPTAIASYLTLILWPHDLTLYHSEMIFGTSQYLLMILTTLTFGGVLIYTAYRKHLRDHFFWLSFFVISLLPVLTPFKIAWVVAERYVYLGTLGILVVIGLTVQKFLKPANRQVALTLGIAILIALTTRTIVRNRDWQNQDTLWLAAAKTSPSSPQNHNNLGDLYGRQGDLKRAVEEFQVAINLQPNYADAYHNLANTYQQMGQTDQAIESYQKAVKFNPSLWQSHQNLAGIYFEQENFAQAQTELAQAAAINPQNANLRLNLAIVYLKLGENDKAKGELEEALKINPDYQPARELLPTLPQ